MFTDRPLTRHNLIKAPLHHFSVPLCPHPPCHYQVPAVLLDDPHDLSKLLTGNISIRDSQLLQAVTIGEQQLDRGNFKRGPAHLPLLVIHTDVQDPQNGQGVLSHNFTKVRVTENQTKISLEIESRQQLGCHEDRLEQPRVDGHQDEHLQGLEPDVHLPVQPHRVTCNISCQ